MTVRKVDFSRFEIQKDPASYNDWAWTGLTLGKLMAISKALETHQDNPLARDCYIVASRAVAAEEKRAKP